MLFSLSMRSGERAGVRGAALVLVMSTAAVACSGEGASEAMARNSLVGLACLLISFAATLTAIWRTRKLGGALAKTLSVIAVLLLMAHPTIWLGVSSGDCGQGLLVTGPIVATLHCGILGLLMLGTK